MTVARSSSVNPIQVTPLMNVADIRRSCRFYTEAFGFEVAASAGPEEDLVWVRLSLGEASLMLNQRGEGRERRLAERADHKDVVLYIGVKDAAKLHGHLVRLGFEIGELEPQDYGLLQFALYDPDGYELAVTSPLHTA